MQGKSFIPNPVLSEILDTGITTDSNGKKRLISDTSVTKNTTQRLYNLIRVIKPRQTLEIGLAYGVSTLCICQALDDNGFGLHIAIDPSESLHWGNAGFLAVRRAGLEEYLEVVEEESQTALPRLVAERKIMLDLAFIDGSHLFESAFVDFYWVDRMLAPGGIIIFDDASRQPIHKIIRFAKRNLGYSSYPAPVDLEKGVTFRERLAVILSKSQIQAIRKNVDFVRRWDDQFYDF